MKTLKIEELSKNFGSTEVLKKINLEIDEGNFLVLLGPSGCGKSTLLNIIAGLETINEGDVFIDDYNVSKVEPKDRNIAMVFQSYALYPSMNVKENMIFGLKQAKTSKEKIQEQLEKVSKFLQVDQLLERKPSQLSGGQRQRVAIGRALVREPRIFLFDEPLSNLDAKLRVEMRREIKKLHQQLKTTVVYVTHDQTEAMSLGTNIAIMNHGVIQQNDTPEKIYNKPSNTFVADFIGSPSMNLIKGILKENSGDLLFTVSGSNLEIPIKSNLAKTIPEQPVWIFHSNEASEKRKNEWLEVGADLFECQVDNFGISIKDIMQKLSEIGVTRLLCEGGGKLAASLIRSELVDEIVTFHGGLTIGADGFPSIGKLGVCSLTVSYTHLRAHETPEHLGWPLEH